MQINIPKSDLENAENRAKYKSLVLNASLTDPHNVENLTVLAVIHAMDEDFAIAEKYARKVVSLAPDQAGYYVTLAHILTMMGKDEEAFQLYKKVYENVNSTCPSINWNYAHTLLKREIFPLGRELYKTRKVHLTDGGYHRFLQPEISCLEECGEKVLIWQEQGIGDRIQFLRYIKPFKERSKSKIILETSEELLTLVETNKELLGIDEVFVRSFDASVPKMIEYDSHVSCLDLPALLHPTSEDFERKLSKTKMITNPSISAGWDLEKNGKLNVGFCWEGSRKHPADKYRSIPLPIFSTLFDLDVNKYNLQYDIKDAPIDPSWDLKIPNAGFVNIEYTMSLIAKLDFIITVDTAIAHMAGVLHIPTLVLVPYASDWRFHYQQTKENLYYPTWECFHAHYHGDFSVALREVKQNANNRINLQAPLC